MKVGTDGVLIGAWAELGTEQCRIVDIGAGSGVISLIVAQRNTKARVTAVEIDPEASSQCSENFSESKFRERLEIVNADIVELAKSMQGKIDYVVSNPPYFNNSLKNNDNRKTTARHTDSLSYDDLCRSVALMLKDKGIISIILPFEESKIFCSIANQHGLYPYEMMEVRGLEQKPVKRVMMRLSKDPNLGLNITQLVIETDVRHQYTEQYRKLTKDFYL